MPENGLAAVGDTSIFVHERSEWDWNYLLGSVTHLSRNANVGYKQPLVVNTSYEAFDFKVLFVLSGG